MLVMKMSFIKYNENDLMELFQSEPVSVFGNMDAGGLIYTYKDNNNFKIILSLDVYRQSINLSIAYNDINVFTGELLNVTSITKIEESMLVKVNNENKLEVKFSNQVGVELLS